MILLQHCWAVVRLLLRLSMAVLQSLLLNTPALRPRSPMPSWTASARPATVAFQPQCISACNSLLQPDAELASILKSVAADAISATAEGDGAAVGAAAASGVSSSTAALPVGTGQPPVVQVRGG